MPYQKDNQGWGKTFQHAVDGCFWAFKTQKNFKVHFLIAFLVIVLAWWREVEATKWLILFLAILFGLTVEMANTAMEKIVDLVTEEYRLNAKIAKDVAAGMMLVMAVGLAVIGILVFLLP
jgi:diacylglycerol kinase